MNRIRENMKDGEDRQKQENTNYEKNFNIKEKNIHEVKDLKFHF